MLDWSVKLLRSCCDPSAARSCVFTSASIDAMSQCPSMRLKAPQELDKYESMIRLSVTSLAHLLALMSEMMSNTTDISLLIIDSISSLFIKEFTASNYYDRVEKSSDRRGAILADLSSRIRRYSTSKLVTVCKLSGFFFWYILILVS